MNERIDLAEYAFQEMYRNMRLAEKLDKEILRDYGHIPWEELKDLVGTNKFHMQQSEMYASVFLAAEMADDSPRRDKYRQLLSKMDASWGDNQIPQPRVATH